MKKLNERLYLIVNVKFFKGIKFMNEISLFRIQLYD